MSLKEDQDIVIVGGGISGLAVALALHRKGIQSVVLERAETIRATGSGLGIYTNGWRALDQLGVGDKLRKTAICMKKLEIHEAGFKHEISLDNEESRCVKRSHLVQVLAEQLPQDSIHLRCQIVTVKLDSITSYPILELIDGRIIKAKIVIGCDGANSAFEEFLGLRSKRVPSMVGVRGLLNYPSGHPFGDTFRRITKDRFDFGVLPIDENQVYWFVGSAMPIAELWLSKDLKLVKDSIGTSQDLPSEIVELVKNTSVETMSVTQLKFRNPLDLLFRKFRKGTITVAGDAMHLTGPFLGQGGSAGLEDSIVLARCLAGELSISNGNKDSIFQKRIGAAIDQYVKERRKRLFRLSIQTYLIGFMAQISSQFVKFVIFLVLTVLFRDFVSHMEYDCGRL